VFHISQEKHNRFSDLFSLSSFQVYPCSYLYFTVHEISIPIQICTNAFYFLRLSKTVLIFEKIPKNYCGDKL
jgi:hypothetical protein